MGEVVFGLFILLFALAIIVPYILDRRFGRKKQRGKLQVAQHLGLQPFQRESELKESLIGLYRTRWNALLFFTLRNVFHRPLADGDLFLFDLVVDSGIESETLEEDQGVAIKSSKLRLPAFLLYPKPDPEGNFIGVLWNKIVEKGYSAMGDVVEFPELPAFEGRYNVVSNSPEAVRHLFDERIAHYFVSIGKCWLRAKGDVFVFAEKNNPLKINSLSDITRRINRALQIYRLFKDK